MDKFSIENDIVVYCVKAKSFPDGVADAQEKIHAIAPPQKGRVYFGISHPQGDEGIIYKAAATETSSGELAKKNLEGFVVPKGEYFMIVIQDYQRNISAIGEAFQKIIADPRIDPNGFCLEWYIGENEVRCMVGINE